MDADHAALPDNAYSNLQRQIDLDIARRVARHKAAVKAVNIQRGEFGDEPIPLIMVADGDSWYDYPLPPIVCTDVIDSLASMGKLTPRILKLAHYGDATTALLGVTKRDRLTTALSDPANGPVDAILFSGGGNDLVGDQFRFWINNAGDVDSLVANAVNDALLDDIFGVVEGAYVDLIGIRDALAKDAVLLFHAYDFAIPTGIGACPFVGPWLLPSLKDRGWTDEGTGAAIVKDILSRFRARLEGICAAHKNVFLVPTQGTLQPGQWANELHPTQDGFHAIAQKFLATLRSVHQFEGRI
jgi:hypothetical protein